jgi:hypothetical protein
MFWLIFAAFAAGIAARHFWPQVKAKLLAWYDAVVAKI